MSEDLVRKLAADLGGTITEMGALPDWSGFAVMSMPLPKDHWSVVNPDAFDVPPMPLRMGTNDTIVIQRTCDVTPAGTWHLTRDEFAEMLRAAARHAYRASTMNGKEPDLNPDALVQNLIVGLLGYWTPSGLSSDEFANP